jgi:hypothetical protein
MWIFIVEREFQRNILRYIKETWKKQCYNHWIQLRVNFYYIRYKLNCLKDDNITYFCIAESKVQVRIAFAFLESIQKLFCFNYTQ